MKALVPLDGSELALSVMPTARALLKTMPGAEIHLVTVLHPRSAQGSADHPADDHPPMPAGTGTVAAPLPRVVESHGEAMEREHLEALEWLEGLAREEFPGVDTHCQATWSRHPAEEIARLAAEAEADLIVMATHGRSGISNLVAGSVTQEVIRSSGRPVLVICPKPDGG